MTEQEKFTVSVSSAKAFSTCQMQWYIGSVEKIRKPQTPEQFIGTIFAELTEELANNGTTNIEELLSQSDVVRSLYNKNQEFLNALPFTTKHAEFELSFGINLYISFLGYIDSVIEDEDSITIRDFKTTKDWKWSLTDKLLGADEQLNIYAYYYNTFYNQKKKPIWIEQQQFHKGTGMKKSPKVPYNHEEGKAIYDWLVEQAEAMVLVKRLKIEEVEKNFSSCGAFGGCPYTNYCKGRINLEELREMINPNVKERTKEQLIEMKPEDRLSELKAEQEFNKVGNEVLNKIKKGDSMNIQEKLALIKAKQMEAKKQQAFSEPVPVGTIIDEKEEAVSAFEAGMRAVEMEVAVVDALQREVTPVMTNFKTDTEANVVEAKKRVRRTKAEMEADATKLVAMPLEKQVELGKALIKDMEEGLTPGKVEVLPKRELVKQVLVLVGCAFLEEDKNNPSDFLHDKYIAPILKQENIPHISCSEFSKANKSVMLFAQSILTEIYEKYESINIDIRRPVDALVYTMIMDLDVRRDGVKRFKLIRSTF